MQTDTKGFDLHALNLTEHGEKHRTLVITHPQTGAPLGIEIDLVAAEGRTGRDLQRRAQKDRLKGNRTRAIDPSEVEMQAVRFLAALVKGWRGVEWKGAVLEFSFENAVMLFNELLWLRKQVDDFVYDSEVFLSGN